MDWTGLPETAYKQVEPTFSGVGMKRVRTSAFGGRTFKSRKIRFRRALGRTASAVTLARRIRGSLRKRNVRTAGFLGIERKFYDTALTATALTAPTDASGGEVDPSATSMISTPAVGDGEQNRDGKRINILSVQVNGTVNLPAIANATTGFTPSRVFVALVLDTQSNAAQMNSEDCFKNTGATAALAANPMRNLLFGKRFRVLKEETFQFTDPNITYDGTNIEQNGLVEEFKWFIPFPGVS